MFSLVETVRTGCSYSNRSLICAIYVVTMKIEVYLVKSPLLKKWHFLDFICAIHVVTLRIEVYFVKFSLSKNWHYLDLICSVYVVTNITESPQKVAFLT